MNDTKERIIRAATKLFAMHGYHKTSMRQITEEAKVNLAAVNYHFGSKKALLETIFMRRLVPLNQIRRQRLADVAETARRDGKKTDVEELLRAFIEPTLKFGEDDPDSGYQIALVFRSLADPDEAVQELFVQYIAPLGHYLFQLLCEALPELEPEVVLWRMRFSMGSIAQALEIADQLNPVLEGVPLSRDVDTLIKILLPFLAAGMKAPVVNS